MYFYHGNKHYYLAQIFQNNNELREALFAQGFKENYETFAYSLADKLSDTVETVLINNGLAVNEYLDNAIASGNSDFLNTISSVFYDVYGKGVEWSFGFNRSLYETILKAIVYGSVKCFFYENRSRYLPQYDWALINSNSKRKAIVDMLFREFDRVSTIADALRYYQDPDAIPREFLVYLQEITGLTLNTYDGVLSESQLRSLTKHLIDVWREKGSLFSIELFFACMGIDCTARELWFDKRLYSNTDGFNEYTKETERAKFAYYLTPQTPYLTSYPYSSEYADYSDIKAPLSSEVWNSTLGVYDGGVDVEKIKELLKEFTYFKSNYILFGFNNIDSSRQMVKAELEVYKELTNKILPIFVKAQWDDQYGSQAGNDDWDILKWYDINATSTFQPYVTDNKNNRRPADMWRIYDTAIASSDGKRYEYQPKQLFGESFVSGTEILRSDNDIESILAAADDKTYIEIVPFQQAGLITGSFPVNNLENVFVKIDKHKIVGFFYKDNDDSEYVEIYPEFFSDSEQGSAKSYENDEPFEAAFDAEEDFNEEKFDQKYSENVKLFEISKWNEDIQAYILDGQGREIQYRYNNVGNVLDIVVADLSEPLTITLI